MYLLGLSLLMLALKYFEIGPVATWSWWWVLAPFAATALWWAWADSTGYTKRKAMEKICLLYTSPSPRDQRGSRMPSSA